MQMAVSDAKSALESAQHQLQQEQVERAGLQQALQEARDSAAEV